jgi:hypothetical protein
MPIGDLERRPVVRRIAVSNPSCLRNVEAVFQHLEARHDIACDGQDNCELRRSDLAGRLDPGLERTDNRGAAVACENVLDIECNGFGQRAHIADEISNRLRAGLTADPWQRPIVALDLEYKIGIEEGSNLGRLLSTADSFQKFLCNSDVPLTAHFVSVNQFTDSRSCVSGDLP